MSWAEEDWTAGLSGRVLQKVKELQAHHERLSRENKQKQLQLDNIHISHDKQTVKYEEMRGELHAVRRELQNVSEEAQVAVKGGQRLSQELQTKQAQVCALEGQLDTAKTLNSKLAQEVKRLEAELEKLQNASRSADNTPFSTPCWSTSSPWEHHGSRKDERTGEREELQNSPHISQRLQFLDAPAPSLPRQHKTSPRGHPSDRSDSFVAPLAVFPWERDDPRPAVRRTSPSSPQTPVSDHQSKQEAPDPEKDLGAQADTSLSQLRRHAASLEEELSTKAETLRSLQDEMALGKKKTAAAELSLQRAHNELSVAQARIGQESQRASGAEQRVKQLQEELKCQRQNAESSRLQHQQRAKELDKQHQRDLQELEKEKQRMEKQHQQEVTKLNQELQQARTLHNGLQARADKLSQQKQTLEKELVSLKDKVRFTEGQLQESKKSEAQIQAKLKEVMLDAAGVALSLEQSKKRERALEEEARRLAEERVDALGLLKQLQEQQAAPLPDCTPLVPACPVEQSFSSQVSSHHARSSAHPKRPPAPRAEPRGLKQEDEDQQRTEISVSAREPGEGIDSEHISSDTECSHPGRNYEEKESSLAIAAPTEGEKDMLILDRLKSEATTLSDDLQRENASLRSELRDAREELQKRLEDLEVQRRAEAEARTRLKQLSRKHASQGAERDEQDKRQKAQLEKEKNDNDRLRTTLAELEERQRGGGSKQVQEDREAEMMRLNLQLKQQLGEVKVQLALEREGREREKEEMTQARAAERELNIKLAELTSQLAALKSSKDEESLGDEKLVANGPLTYLTLHSDTIDFDVAVSDEQAPSPQDYAHFCQSTNQINALVSQQSAKEAKHSRSEDTVSARLHEEIERLRGENAQERQRANQLQIKLTALQNQLTSQTQQLTLGFEKQSQYISGLLGELQEKDGALLSQGQELRCCIQSLEALKEELTGEEGETGRKGNNCKVETEGQLQDALNLPNHKKDRLAGQYDDQVLQQSIQSDASKLLPKQDAGSDALPIAPSASRDISSEMGRSHDEIINYLQAQVLALQRERQEQAEELAMWRLASQPSTLDQVLPSRPEEEPQHSAKDQSAALVVREDEVLLSCISSRLQGRMLSTSLQQGTVPGMSVRLPPDHMSKPSEKQLGSLDQTQACVVDSSGRTAAERLSGSADASAASVSTQTEWRPWPGGAEPAPERRCKRAPADIEARIQEEDGSPRAPQAALEAGGKMLFSTSFPIPADPVRLAERIRRNRTQLSAAFDDTEYEPYGLPEVVMKGFADIPTGPSCPYIVRRGLLGTAVVPVTPKEVHPEDETD